MSSILDALNKRPGSRRASAGGEPLKEGLSRRRRRGGSGPSLLRITLWVVTTVAVGAFTGLFLVYRLAALGMAAGNPLEGLTAPGSARPSEPSPAALTAVLKDAPAAPEGHALTIRGGDLEPAPARPLEVVPEAPLEPTLPASPPATVPEPLPAEETAEPAETAPAAKAEEFHLKGIMLNADRPMAIINGRLVGVGERVEGRKVLAISRDGVRLEDRAALLRIYE